MFYFKLHTSILLQKCCVENKNHQFISRESQNVDVTCSNYVLHQSNKGLLALSLALVLINEMHYANAQLITAEGSQNF